MYQDIETLLIEKKAELESRLDRISRGAQKPLDKDSKERALELENEEVLESLTREGRQELDQVYQALERMKIGTFGLCATCQQRIPLARLRAIPFSRQCVNCVQARSA